MTGLRSQENRLVHRVVLAKPVPEKGGRRFRLCHKKFSPNASERMKDGMQDIPFVCKLLHRHTLIEFQTVAQEGQNLRAHLGRFDCDSTHFKYSPEVGFIRTSPPNVHKRC